MLNTPQQTKSRNWDTLAWHIHHVICADNKIVAEYLTKLLAYWVQNPEKFGEVAIVLRGEKGLGKSVLAKVLQSWFPNSFMHITQPTQLTNYFNSELASATLVFADEIMWKGHKQGESALKALTIEKPIQINPKGRDSFLIPNRLKMLIAANRSWTVPINEGSPCYLVLDVNKARMGDREYFDKLYEAIDNGEATAMLDNLLQYDLSTFTPRSLLL